jgi:hypothetical protein
MYRVAMTHYYRHLVGVDQDVVDIESQYTLAHDFRRTFATSLLD